MKEIIVIEKKYIKQDVTNGYDLETIVLEDKKKKTEQVPENIEDIKTLLDNLKIVHKTFYTNEKDYKWTEKDKVKILRAIVIRLKLKDDGEFNENTITIDNENRISIEKFMFEGREFVDLQLSTTNQCWQIIKNLIGEE
jgi:hypothetical protein